MSLGNYLWSSQVLVCSISKDVMRESKKNEPYMEKVFHWKKGKKKISIRSLFCSFAQIPVSRKNWAHFQIISPSFT